jgi:hypothetical protein
VTDENLIQRAFTAVLTHFVTTGRAPHYSELADALGVAVEAGRQLMRDTVQAAPIASC